MVATPSPAWSGDQHRSSRTPDDPHRPRTTEGARQADSGLRRYVLSLREAQVRLTQLVGLAELTNQVTMIERDGRPVAALVPAPAAYAGDDARDANARAAEAQRQAVEARDQVTQAHEQVRQAREEAIQARHEATQARQQAVLAQRQAVDAQQQAALAQRQVAAAQQRLGAAQDAVRAAQQETAATRDELRVVKGRVANSAAGWARRLDELREQLGRRHRAELAALTGALGQAWAELDRYCPPGADRDVDELRSAHGHRYVEPVTPRRANQE